MFSLQDQKAKLSSVNPRAELHGEDTNLAADLKIEMKVSNSILSEFDPSLKSALYKAADASEGQGALAIEDGHLPALKFPLMGAIKWGKEFAGYGVTIPYGISGKEDINLADCEVDNFVFECQDGGTVGVKFRVICHPSLQDMGRLCEKIQQEIDITLTPPSAEEQLQ